VVFEVSPSSWALGVGEAGLCFLEFGFETIDLYVEGVDHLLML